MYYAIITKQNKIINNKTCLCCCNFITWCSFPPNCSHTKITFNCYFLKFLIKQWALRCQLRSELWSAVSRPAKDPRQTELSAATWPGHTWPPASPPPIGQHEVTLGNIASLLVIRISFKIPSAILHFQTYIKFLQLKLYLKDFGLEYFFQIILFENISACTVHPLHHASLFASVLDQHTIIKFQVGLKLHYIKT